MNLPKYLQGTMIALGVASAATAQIVPTVVVNSDIATSTTWGPPNIYRLAGEIHVLDGATLTILPGTVIASNTTVTFPTPGSGPAALVVDRGAMLFANGTQTSPIVFTSMSETGSYRQTATAEWGGLGLLGEAYISENQVATNTGAPSSGNYSTLEGTLRAGLRDYGGGQVVTTFPTLPWTSDGEGDNDDSGSLSFVSIRYNGFVAGSTVELNGLQLGGVGRNTDVHHIESINSVDDGIEIYGGTVNLKYINVWSCGDDSFDVDQGWRGRAQHGLIVQGYSSGGASGSGYSDNAFEMDGAEFCHYQPVTTATIYNFTVIGAPSPTNGSNGSDEMTAWRDNARVQFRSCIFMDAGDNVITNNGTDGENGNAVGYGCNGTLSWANTWLTPSTTTSLVNPFPGAPELTPAQAYTAQVPGNLIDFRDCLFYNNLRPAAYGEAIARGVLAPYAGNNNHNLQTATQPLTLVQRGAAVVVAAGSMLPMAQLNPLPASAEARTSVEWALESYGFFDGSRYRGGFGEGNNWLPGWSGCVAYGLVVGSTVANIDLGLCRAGSQGCPQQITTGDWSTGAAMNITIKNLDPVFSACVLVAGVARFDFPILGGTLVPTPDIQLFLTGAGGTASTSWINPTSVPGASLYTQALGLDVTQFGAGFLDQFSFSNAQQHVQP